MEINSRIARAKKSFMNKNSIVINKSMSTWVIKGLLNVTYDLFYYMDAKPELQNCISKTTEKLDDYGNVVLEKNAENSLN